MRADAPSHKFALFKGPTYYPGEGWDDFIGFYDSAEEAQAKGEELSKRVGMGWWQVVDLVVGRVVASGRSDD